MPIYFLCPLDIPIGIIKQLERIERQCPWRGNSDTPRQSLAAWELVCRPKANGGLGVINLQIQNQALLVKHLHKFYNKADIPWVSLIWDSYYHGVVPQATVLCGSFWWKDVFELADNYRAVATVIVNSRDSVLLWSDGWHLDGSTRPLRDRLPHLFSYAIDDKISVSDFLSTPDIASLFNLPISQVAATELLCLQDWIANLQRNPMESDVWCWLDKGNYSAKSYYTLMHTHLPVIQPCRWLWKSKCTMKIKCFTWLLFFDRLNTKDLLVRRKWRSTDKIISVSCHPQKKKCALLEDMRIGFIFSSHAISASGFGTTCRLIGHTRVTLLSAFCMLKTVLAIHSSLRFSLL